MTATLLRALRAGAPLPGRHLLVTAHPDDETISAAAVLSTASDVRILQLTTGADNKRVADLRTAERRTALQAARWEWPVYGGLVPGRTAHEHVGSLAAALGALLAEADVVWTHPYEGGHLDHDTAAWLVQQACADGSCQRMEFASYHATKAAQTFGDIWPDPTVPAVMVQLSSAVLARKQAAIAAYVSQAAILRKFPRIAREVYRAAPVYNFSKPPAPPRCRWDLKGYQPSTAVWRATVARAQVAA